jgi:hypothetical protein
MNAPVVNPYASPAFGQGWPTDPRAGAGFGVPQAVQQPWVCAGCGKQNQPHHDFCLGCGGSRRAVGGAFDGRREYAEYAGGRGDSRQRSPVVLIVVVVAVFAALALVGVAALVLVMAR